jgi:RHS repeat-associated protein
MRENKSPEDVRYRYGYQGQYAEKDEETGWNHFELREYDAVIGRWLVPDPMRQYPSPYMALGNNPINKVDPNGGCDDCPKFEVIQLGDIPTAPHSSFDLSTGLRWTEGVTGLKFLLDWSSEIDLSLSSFNAANSLVLQDSKLWSRVSSSYGISFRYIDRTSDVFRATSIGSTPISVRLGNFAGNTAPVLGKLSYVTQGLSLGYDAHLLKNNKITSARFSYKLGSAGTTWYVGYYAGGWAGAIVGIGSYGVEKIYDNFIEPGLWYISGKSVEFQNAMKNGYPYTNMTNGVWPKR